MGDETCAGNDVRAIYFLVIINREWLIYMVLMCLLDLNDIVF